MSGLKRGTIIVECDHNMKNRFYKILPFTEGLQINFEDDDDCIQIQYELDNQDIETLVSVLNQQDKKEFRLISHVDEFPQFNNKEYDLARDISRILNLDDDNGEAAPQGRDGSYPLHQEQGPSNLGTIGSRPIDDRQKPNSNSKGLKSKSSSFYPPNDPRSSMQEDQSRGNPAMAQQNGEQAGLYNQVKKSVPYRVDDFDQIFEDDEPNYPPRQPGPNPQMMMNPNLLQRGVNPNMNPNMNPGAKPQAGLGLPQQGMNMMGHAGMGAGPIGSGQMYGQPNQPGAAGRYGKVPPQPAAGMPLGPAYPPGKQPRDPQTGRPVQPAQPGQPDHGYYPPGPIGAGYEDPQAKNPKAARIGGAKGAPARAYPEYGGYQEDEGMLNYQEYPPAPGPRGAQMNPQMPGYPPARGAAANNPQHYGQYAREDYADPRLGYGDMNAGMMNPNPQNPNLRGPIGAPYPNVRNPQPVQQPAPQQRYPPQQQYGEEEYYEGEEEQYDEYGMLQQPMPGNVAQRGRPRSPRLRRIRRVRRVRKPIPCTREPDRAACHRSQKRLQPVRQRQQQRLPGQ